MLRSLFTLSKVVHVLAEAAAARVRKSGLPLSLAERLLVGK